MGQVAFPAATVGYVARALHLGTPVWLLTDTATPDLSMHVGEESAVRARLLEWLGEEWPAEWTLRRVNVATLPNEPAGLAQDRR